MINILPLDFLVASQLHERIKMPFTICKYLYVRYANEMTNDVIYSTQYHMMYSNRAILANLGHRPLKLGRLIGLKETHQRL